MTEAVEPKTSEGKKGKKDNTETWISNGASEHQILVNLDGEPEVVKFKDYGLTLNMSDARDKKLSKALSDSGQERRSIFRVGAPYPDDELGKKADMLKKLMEMEIPQLRAMLTVQEYLEAGIPTNTTDRSDLVTLILATKSI